MLIAKSWPIVNSQIDIASGSLWIYKSSKLPSSYLLNDSMKYKININERHITAKAKKSSFPKITFFNAVQ